MSGLEGRRRLQRKPQSWPDKCFACPLEPIRIKHFPEPGWEKNAPSAALGSSFKNKVLSSPWTLIWCAAVALCTRRSRLRGVVYFCSAGADFSGRIPTAADWRFPQQIRLIPGPEIAAEQLRLGGDTQLKGCDVELANQANHESPQSQINHIQASRLTRLSTISVLCSTLHPEGCFFFLSLFPCCSH